jgi:protocatechuate 3,4-dioxygenase beta subunit
VTRFPWTRLRRSSRVLALTGLALIASGAALASGPARAASGDSCPPSNRPDSLVVVSGSPQTAQLGKQFQTNLQVALANTNGCPLSGPLGGYAVRFVAPSTGASGRFAGSGTDTVTVGTDANGTATAPPFTANDTAGNYTVVAESDFGTANLNLTNTASGLAASITAIGGTSQLATVDRRYAQPLQARVVDANGQPVQGVNVAFTLATGSSGASASFLTGGGQASATTDAGGVATSPLLVANASPGRFDATASTADLASAATFTLNNRAAANTLVRLNRATQIAKVRRRYAKPLKARLLDEHGQPIEGATVTFTIATAASGATASFVGGSNQATALTDAGGRATSPALTANTKAGSFTATATTAAVPTLLRYSLRNRAGAPAALSAGAADGESTPTGTRFPIPLVVTVKDGDSNPIAGATVTFVAPAHGPSGHFDPRGRARRVVRVKTNSKGIAVAPPFVANGESGGYAVLARAGGQRTAFALVNSRR